ncbi:heptaprenyl diphosphate synthase component 1 [Bacillus sp. FJAT-45350]|uniref:heptaprenyl diphosphate synthase component 1 n=1 Tax=Bacillus sp. FJAT-45350 TaxID=2011014 RepID=UPI000BB77DE7|nr:heptaprenyl diphosphate synthase component 1 [Bacillus sp. FJAT-45350]
MVRLHHFNEKVIECKKQFYTIIKHSFLQRYIPGPGVDEDKLCFLYAMLDEELRQKKDMKAIALSTLLVDSALKTHEEVSLHKVNSDYVKKNRQLSVLAGDYYSSLYYYLLADSGQIQMIKVFSQSIQEIHESKMFVYQNKDLTFEQAISQLRSIDSALLQNIAEHFGLLEWKKAISEFFLLKRLLHEREQWELEKKDSAIIIGIKQDFFVQSINQVDEKLVADFLTHKISQTHYNLLALAEKDEQINALLNEQLDEIVNSDYREKVAEEG